MFKEKKKKEIPASYFHQVGHLISQIMSYDPERHQRQGCPPALLLLELLSITLVQW